MTDKTRADAMIWGSFVADAATMGLHWLYDQNRIRDVAPDAPEFVAPNADNFAGVPAFFAHATRRAGDLSQYGEQQLVMLQSLAAQGRYDRADYQARFRAHFGYGGGYVGYIDRPTRDTLLPALVARHADDPQLMTHVEDAVRVTNNNDTAVSFAKTAAKLLQQVLATGAIPDLTTLIADADPVVKEAISTALNRTDETTQTITADIGMSCNLDLGVPSIFHNLATTTGYIAGVRSNIYAGGDNCGRSIVLGAALGAVYGVPQDWIDLLTRKDAIAAALTI